MDQGVLRDIHDLLRAELEEALASGEHAGADRLPRMAEPKDPG